MIDPADPGGMRDRKKPDRGQLEAFADAMLAPHRTAPPRQPDGDRIDDLPFAYRRLRSEDAPPLDAHMVQRIRRHQRTFGYLSAAQAIVTLVGTIGLGFFLYELLTTF